MPRPDAGRRYLERLLAGVLITVSIVIVALGGAVLRSHAYL
jgi:hypothetical protein